MASRRCDCAHPQTAGEESGAPRGSSRDSLLAAVCITITFLTGVTLRPLAFFFVNFVHHHQLTRQQASWVVSLTSASVVFSGVLAKILLRQFALWPVIMVGAVLQAAGALAAYFATNYYVLAATFGLMHGIGAGLVFVLSGVFIERNYKGARRRLVMRLNVSASCAAGVVFPRILLLMRDHYKYEGLILFSGTILLNVPVLCILLRCNERKEPNNNTTSSSTQGRVFTIERKLPSSATAASQFAPRNMFKQPLFYIIAVTHLVFFYVINLYGSIAVDTILDKGIPVILAITVAPTVSVFDWVGRVLLPIASQRGYVRPSVLLTLDYFVVACGLFLIPYAYDHPTMLVTCVSFGAFSGHAITVHGSLMVDYIGSAQANLANIIITCVATAAFFTKPFVVGTIRDDIGSYDSLYYVFGFLVLSAAVVWLIVNCALRYRRRKTWKTTHSQLRLCDEPKLLNYQPFVHTSMMAE